MVEPCVGEVHRFSSDVNVVVECRKTKCFRKEIFVKKLFYNCLKYSVLFKKNRKQWLINSFKLYLLSDVYQCLCCYTKFTRIADGLKFLRNLYS